MTLNFSFDRDNFIDYVRSINGDLRLTPFYNKLTNSETRKTNLINEMLGVTDTVTPKIDILALYNNWGNGERARSYASDVSILYLSEGNQSLVVNLNLFRLFSAYLLQYYFFFKKTVTDFLPKLVSNKTAGYYPQTYNFYLFFSDFRVRGMGNNIISPLCTETLTPLGSIENQRTYVSFNTQLIQWCGCFSPLDPDIVAAAQSLPSQENSTFPTFSQECDPLCVNSSAVKLFDENGFDQLKCQSAVCVLSNISLNVEGATTRQFNFNQICNACQNSSLNTSGQPCRCIVDSEFASTITKIQAPDGNGMDVSTTFARYCPNSICVVIDKPTGVPQVLPCNELNPSATGLGEENYATSDKRLTFSTSLSDDTIGLLVALMIIFILMAVIVTIRSSKKITVT